MYKRFIMTAFLFGAVLTGTNAQDCIPDDTITKPGFYPEELDSAYSGQFYEQVIQLRVIKDTTIYINGNPIVAIIDSVKLTQVMGLPSSIDYSCSRRNCAYIPDSTGCAVLYGTPSIDDTGSYPLQMEVLIYAKVFGSPTTQFDTLEPFTLEVVEGTVSVASIHSASVKVYPNPVTSGAVRVNGLHGERFYYNLSDLSGRSIFEGTSNEVVPVSELAEGLYWLGIQTKDGERIFRKISVLSSD